jgi:hypothetical protein
LVLKNLIVHFFAGQIERVHSSFQLICLEEEHPEEETSEIVNAPWGMRRTANVMAGTNEITGVQQRCSKV